MSECLRIAVVDDHPLFREGVCHALRANKDFEVVGEGSTGDEAIACLKAHQPDILLLDLHMPGGGIGLIERAMLTSPETKVIMLTVSQSEQDVSGALQAGARGYILKGISGRELVTTIRNIHSGEAYVTPELAARLLSQLKVRKAGEAKDAPLASLTSREEDILDRVASGRTNKEIARDLNLSEKTVKHYMTNIMQKLQVRNRVEAASVLRRTENKPER
jgi:DNA-binding NarL/FixJ family response regulator